MSSYQPGIPTGTVPLNEDYLNIQNNFQQLNTSFGVDHVPFSVALNFGYHNVVHLIPTSTTASNPPNNQPITPVTAVPGIGELFCSQINDGFDTDETLYYQSGGNKLIELTRNIVPVMALTGITFLPGGLVIQWGTITNAVNQVLTAVTFVGLGAKAFPANNFSMWANLQSTTTGVNNVYLSSFSTTGFSYMNTSSTQKRFNWIAIGN